MTAYRYLAYDLRTNTRLEDLQLQGVTFGAQLNNAGAFQASLALNQRAQTAPGVTASRAADLLTATQPGRTVIYVERDGVLLDGYIVWTRNYQARTGTVLLGGKSLWSYFERRRNNTRLEFLAVDQFAIARTLLDTAQAKTGGNIAVATGSATCGVTRDRLYNSWDLKNVGEAVRQLAAVDNGFDFAIDVTYSAGAPVRTLTLSYPRRGRTVTASGHRFETGRNLIDYNLTEDATAQADVHWAVGAGEGPSMLIGIQARTDIIDAGWPLLEDATASKDVSVQATLDAHAQALVNAKANPVTLLQATVTAGGDPPIGAWIVGDDAVFIVGGDPARPDPRFPTRTELVRRIIGYTATPGDAGSDLVTLTLQAASA